MISIIGALCRYQRSLLDTLLDHSLALQSILHTHTHNCLTFNLTYTSEGNVITEVQRLNVKKLWICVVCDKKQEEEVIRHTFDSLLICTADLEAEVPSRPNVTMEP